MFFYRRIFITTTIFLLTLMSYGLIGQQMNLFQKINPSEKAFHPTKKDPIQRLKLQTKALNTLYNSHLETSFKLLVDNETITIKLHPTEISEHDYYIQEINHGEYIRHRIKKPHTYRGHIEEYPNAIIALTTDNKVLRAMLSIPNKGQYNIGVDKSLNHEQIYMISKDNDLNQLGPFSCSANDDLFYREANNLDLRSIRTTCKKVRVSIHIDYDMYLQKNRNMQQVANYVFGLFNESGTLFLNEGIHTSISEIIVHTREDNLPHTSANDDLSQFKRDFTSYNGDLIICLSGYRDQGGNAPLGGTAYTNSLCIKRFSYAYANVYGNYKLYPNFSWDVQVFTHELGHIMGSPHTHSCSWGPQQNLALDDCYPTTGGCPPGPAPIKGTIMSYCHLPGRPGIDFTYGFGREPGDRIRAKIESSFCLIDYIPEKNIPTSMGKTIANVECSDGDLTHYYFDNYTIDEADDIWLLSVDTKGQDIGHIGDNGFEVAVEVTSNDLEATEITAAYVDPKKPFFVINKHWTFKTFNQPINAVSVTFPYSKKEFESLERQVADINMNEIEPYLIERPGNSNPATNHAGTTRQYFSAYTYAPTEGNGLWTYERSPYGYHIAHYQVTRLDGGGMGVHAAAPLPVELIYFEANNIEGWHYINWATSLELNLDNFVLERSDDGFVFNDIATMASNGDISSNESYEYIDKMPLNGKNYYRLKSVDMDGSYSYSPIVQLYNNDFLDKTIFTIAPNPVINGQMNILQTGKLSTSNIQVQIRNISGYLVRDLDMPSEEKSIIDIHQLYSGLYLVEISTGVVVTHKRILVQ